MSYYATYENVELSFVDEEAAVAAAINATGRRFSNIEELLFDISLDANGYPNDSLYYSDTAETIFSSIAPYVEAGSFVNFKGEDGSIWGFRYDGEKMTEVGGKIVYDDDKEDSTSYLIFAYNDECNPFVIGVATTEKAAEEMAKKSNEEMEGTLEYSITKVAMNKIDINNCVYSFSKTGEITKEDRTSTEEIFKSKNLDIEFDELDLD